MASFIGTGASNPGDVKTGGKVGIGTTSDPITILDVRDDSTVIMQSYLDNGTDACTRIGNTTVGTQIFPSSILIDTGSSPSTTAFLGFKSGGKISYDNNNKMQFQTNASTKVTIDSGGNVGIGTTSPGLKLTVQDDGNTLRLQSTGSGKHTYMDFYCDGAAGARSGYLGFPSNACSYIEIKSEKTNGSIALTPSGSGGIGIGTTQPSYMLQVAGCIALTGSASGVILPLITSAPASPADGQIIYVDGNWGGLSKGIYACYNSAWNRLG
jgi:hypothetical protein